MRIISIKKRRNNKNKIISIFYLMSEKDIKKLLNQFISFEIKNEDNNNKSNPFLQEIINYLKNNNNIQTEILKEIILICNDYISSSYIPNKNSGISLILQIITLYEKSLNSESQNLVLKYIIPKFKDIICVPYLVKIIYFLYEQYSNLKKEITNEIIIIYKGENLNIPAYTQETRIYAIKLLNKIILEEEFNEEKKQESFISVIIDCIDDEKDPRNIIEMFNLLDILYKKFPKNILIKYSKEIFDIINSYYPINFTPPKDIKNPISSKELSNLLNKIISLEFFSEYFFEEINEYELKDSCDILQTLQKIFENYSKESLQKYYSKIMGYILNTIQNNYDENINIFCLITLTNFLKKYSPYDNQVEKDFLIMSDNIFSEEIKNSYNAKDIISSIIEFDSENKFIYKTSEVIIKLISLFLFSRKNKHYLKNANSLLFFLLRKQNIISQIFDLLIKNKQMFASLIKDKKVYENDIQIFIFVTDIITSLIVKISTKEIFSNEEIIEIYNLIYNHYYELNEGKKKDYEHISYCIVSLSLKIKNNLLDLIKAKFMENNSEEKIKEISILKCFLELYENKKEIINFLIMYINNFYIKDLIFEILKNNYEKYHEILIFFCEQFEKIILDNFENSEYINLIIELLNKDFPFNYINLINNFLTSSLNENSLKFISISFEKIDNNNNDYCDSIYENLKNTYFNKNLSFKIKEYLSDCIYKLLPLCSEDLKNKMNKDLINNIKTIYNNCDSEEKFKLIECYYSSIINYFILKTNIEDISFSLIIKELIEMINNSKFKKVYESSKLFYISEISENKRDYILIQLKKFYKERTFLNLILNLYLTFSEEEKKENIDLIFLTNYQCLLNDINSEKIILNIKNILANNTDSENLKRLNEFRNYFEIINKVINIISQNQINQNLKIEGLKLIGIIKDYITEDELKDYDKNIDIIISLKQFLCDKKRKVRKICAIVINIWNYIK